MFKKYAVPFFAALLVLSIAAPAADARTLREGNRGQDVGDLQRLLNGHGAQIKVDGIYGEQTEKAVTIFQRDKHLKVDGFAGPQTLKALRG